MRKGFTLIEILICIGIAGVLSAIVANSFRTAQIRKEQQGIIQTLTANLEKQKSDTQAGKDGSNYGVKFNAANYVLFKGTSYSASSSANRTVTLDSKFQIGETISNASNIIYFARLNGNANETATITVSHVTNRVPAQNIVIENSGTISVIE